MDITPLTLVSLQYLNAPYKWAANGPFEFDCSGLVCKVLRDLGHEIMDMTAQGLYHWSLKNGLSTSHPDKNTLLFFGRNLENITHIAIGINKEYMIECGGGGRESVDWNLEDNARMDARVRIKSISNRRDLLTAIKIME